MPPQGPIDVPPEAIAALASLREAFAPLLPPETQFGIGIKQTGGEYLDQLALTVFVPEKIPLEEIPVEQIIPPLWVVNGLEFVTDVVQSNPTPIAIVNDTGFYSPLLGGIEIGWDQPMGVGLVTTHIGTLGCLVQRRSNGERLGLTANHVAPLSVDVSQPAPGHFQSAVIGSVVKAHATWDCSAIEFNGTRGTPLPRVQEIGPVRGEGVAQLWGAARKRGRTTGLTSGLVVAFTLDSSLAIERLRLDTFPFGDLYCFHGDSGSAILDGNDDVIGLLLEMDNLTVDANGQPVSSIGLAAPIRPVVDVLDVEIAIAPPVVSQVQPNTAFGVLGTGGQTQIDGLGFDAGSTVTFGGVPALSVIPASPRRLIVTPPVQFAPGVTMDVLVSNQFGEQSLPSPNAQFTY